jgi:predicted GNAT superfamily acetyltransferase
VGVGSIVGQALAEREILRAAGYDKLADTFDPLDPVALAMGVVPGVIGAR